MTATESSEHVRLLEQEIADLESRLAAAKARRNASSTPSLLSSPASLHALFLLADSALPLGSFAFSSGLESYLAHNTTATSPKLAVLNDFLRLTLRSTASTSLPYVLAGYQRPSDIIQLDNDFDASILCNVARRASVAQGRGLLTVWEKAFGLTFQKSELEAEHQNNDKGRNGGEPQAALRNLTMALKVQYDHPPTHGTSLGTHRPQHRKGTVDEVYLPGPSIHLAPLWGLITAILGIRANDSLYLFLYSHLRTVVSAAVRANVLGPYQAQALLASAWVRDFLEQLIAEVSDDIDGAGQTAPIVDLWLGRHEMLYSRIFNS